MFKLPASTQLLLLAIISPLLFLMSNPVLALGCPAWTGANNDSATCEPVEIPPWIYITQYIGEFPTEQAAQGAARADAESGGGWCSVNGSSQNQNQDSYVGGILTYRRFIYTVTLVGPSDGDPACSSTQYVSYEITHHRLISCPAGSTLIYDTNQAICIRSSSAPDIRKNLGTCPTPQVPADPAPPECPHAGNPINVATLNKLERQVDYVGTGQFPLAFSRYYNSRASLPATAPPVGIRDSNYLGLGWSASYFQFLHLGSSGGTTYVTAYRPDGRTIRFAGTTGIFSSEADATAVLTKMAGGWQFVDASGTLEMYASDGRLLSIKARHGETHSLSYDGANRLAAVNDDFGHSLQFEYANGGTNAHLASIVLPSGDRMYYSTSANLTQTTYADGTSRKYLYRQGDSVPHLLVGVVDENNSRLSYFTYDESEDGYAIETSRAGGVNKYTITSPPDSGYVDLIDPLGNERNLSITTIHGVNRLSDTGSFCASCPIPHSIYHDDNGNVSSRIDPNGSVTNYSYDLSRNLQTSRTEADGTPLARTITTQWQSAHRLPTLITESNRKTAFTYDSSGNTLTKTVTDIPTGMSRSWTYTYNSFGQVLTMDGPRTDVSDITTYTYYACATGFQCGRLHTVTNARGHVTTYNTYNAHGQPLNMTGANGVVTTLTYDTRQRLRTRTVAGETTTFDYWLTGLLKKAALPDGSYLLHGYDAAHRLTEISDSEGNRVAYTLDNMGNRTKEETFDPSSTLATTRTEVFNSLNQLSEEIHAAGTAAVTTTFGYDTTGNMISIASPMSRITGQSYDELNRLTAITDPAMGVTSYGYNALDQLISVTDPRGLSTTYTYDGLGDLQQQASPDTGTTANTYDSGGNLATSTDARGAISTYTYDSLNRVTTTAFKMGATTDQTITYNYDAGTYGTGRMTSASDSDHSMTWTYDALGRVTSKSQVVSGFTKTVSYGYTNGQLTTMTMPSGRVITYGYTNNRITSIQLNTTTTVLSNVLYEPFGPPRQWTWGNGTLAVRTHDQDGKVTQVDSAGLKTYSYDDAFRITGITDTANAANSWTYGYDALDRLTSGAKPSQTMGWSYDANGNRLAQSGPPTQSHTYSATSNRALTLTGSTNLAYSYDAAGNVSSDTIRSYSYNYRGRIKAITAAGNTTTYTYNVLGERIRKSGSRLYVYDEAGHLIGEYNLTSGAVIQETIWMGDTPIAVAIDSSIFYVHTDHLNTPRKITNTSNGVRWQWDPTPFGNGLPNQNPQGLGVFNYYLRFPGQYYDNESQLHYNYFRNYDSYAGRYVQSDPIGLEGGINTYAYVDANPLTWSDPLGLDPKGERGATGGVGGKNTSNPYKHCREFDPPERDFVRCKDHQSGKWVRKPRPAEMPFPGAKSEMCGEDCKDTAATVVVAGGTAYIVYRCVRMVPSLMPPLWPTIPANLVVP